MYMRAVKRVKWEISQEQERLFIEETGNCEVQVINPAHFPIFNMSLQFRSDEHLLWRGELEVQRSHNLYQIPLQIEGKGMTTITLTGIAKGRGVHGWRDAELIISDCFIFFLKCPK